MARTPSLRQLRAFRKIMSTGGMTAAAEALNLTQPALSKQIASLEDTLKLRLFNRRKGGPMMPTQEGLAFFKSIEGTLYGLDAIPGIAEDLARAVRSELKVVATPPLINSRVFLATLADFRAQVPEAKVSLAARPRIDLEDWVISRQADISLGLLPSRHPDVTDVALLSTYAVAVLPNDHPLADRSSITQDDLTDIHLILPDRQPLREQIDAALPGLRCDIETSSSIASVGLAVSQRALAICDPLSPTMFPPDYARVLPFEPRIPLIYGAIFPRNSKRDPLVDVFMQCLEHHFADSET